MGNSEEEKPPKLEKPSSPATDQNSIHVNPDWAMMQAYYGPRFAVPPYLNSAVASHTAPFYMWIPPQSIFPHYGVPHTAFNGHGGIHGHPGASTAGTAFSMDTQVKSSGNMDRGFMKKLKEFDGLAISIGKGNTDHGEHGTDYRLSESEETGNSSNGSNGDTAAAGQSGTKRSRPRTPNIGDCKAQKRSSSFSIESRGSEKMRETIHPANTPAEMKDKMSIVSETKDPNVQPNETNVQQPSTPNEALLQNEQELKQERRKQSNRDSARRSRLRKQAEAEELSTKVQALTTENTNLKSKINKFIETSKKLKLENSTLVEKLNDAQLKKQNFHKVDDLRLEPVVTANLLARVNNNDSTDKRNEDGAYENRSAIAKLHQLLDTIASPRADAVAAN